MRVQLDQVCKQFPAPGGGLVAALVAASFTVESGDMVMVVGPNGAGKSTLLGVIAGDLQPDAGVLTFQGRAVAKSRDRPRTARIRQDPAAGAVDEFSLAENLRLVRLPALPSPWRRALSRDAFATAAAHLRGTALSSQGAARRADELSYGQRQLLALEMAASRDVELLLLDEPTASLDQRNGAACMERAEEVTRELGLVTIVVTHDMALAARFGTALVVMREGRVAAHLQGPAKRALGAGDIFELCGFDKLAGVRDAPTATT